MVKALRMTESCWFSVHTGKLKKQKDSGSGGGSRLDALTNTRGRQADEEATALAGQMAQWVKTTKPDDWSLISPWDTCGGWKD